LNFFRSQFLIFNLRYASILAAQGALAAALSYLGQSNEDSISQLRDRLHGALGGQVAKPERKTSQSSTYSGSRRAGTRPSWNSGGSGGTKTAYTGIHNPAAEDINAFQPPVPHLDQGGITQRRGSRPPAEPSYDPYSSQRRISNERMMPPGPVAPQQQTFIQPQPPVSIFTPDYTQGYNQGSMAPPSSALHNSGKNNTNIVFKCFSM
jgi:hypothetical protein